MPADQKLKDSTAEGVSGADKQKAIAAHRREAIEISQSRELLTQWSHDTLAMFSTADNPHTNYHYYDDGGEEPQLGGALPAVEQTASQFSRYEEGLKAVRTTTRAPTSIKPYLSTPIAQCADVVAFRNNLIAVKSGIGIYKLIPIGEQIFHTRSSLERGYGIRNTSDATSRVLHNLKERPNSTKQNIVALLIGIVGTAHRGYHTLNVESAKKRGKRIGDCMIEVAWKSRIPDTSTGQEVGTVIINNSVGYYTSFETRTDWRAFRGRRTTITVSLRRMKAGNSQNGLKAIEAKVDALQKTQALLTQRASSENAYYSDSENEDDDEDDK